MKQDVIEKIDILEGLDVEVKVGTVIIKSEEKENRKLFDLTNINVSVKDNQIVLETKNARKKDWTMINTIKAHLLNMMNGLKENFVYKLEVAFVHFPITVEHDKEKNQLVIKNFLGEKTPRTAILHPEAEIAIDGNIITIESHNREIAGQTAANIEKATRVKNKDRRKFQDGIYITEKCGKAI